MATGRQPRQKGENTNPEILRPIRLGDNDVYGPGEEDEFLEALEGHIDELNAAAGENGKQLDVNDELHRLSVLGHIVNFKGVDLEEDDIEDSDQDLNANRRAARAARDSAPGDETTPRSAGPSSRRKAPAPTKGVQSNEELKRTNDGTGDATA